MWTPWKFRFSSTSPFVSTCTHDTHVLFIARTLRIRFATTAANFLSFQPDLREVMNMTGKVGGARASASHVTPQNSEKRVKSNARVKNYS